MESVLGSSVDSKGGQEVGGDGQPLVQVRQDKIYGVLRQE